MTILKLISPITPFVTEEIYQEHFRKFEKDKSIHISGWPESNKFKQKDLDEVSTFFDLVKIIARVRKEKTKAKKSMNSEIVLTIKKSSLKELGKKVLQDLKNVTNAKEIKEGKFKVEFTEENKK